MMEHRDPNAIPARVARTEPAGHPHARPSGTARSVRAPGGTGSRLPAITPCRRARA